MIGVLNPPSALLKEIQRVLQGLTTGTLDDQLAFLQEHNHLLAAVYGDSRYIGGELLLSGALEEARLTIGLLDIAATHVFNLRIARGYFRHQLGKLNPIQAISNAFKKARESHSGTADFILPAPSEGRWKLPVESGVARRGLALNGLSMR